MFVRPDAAKNHSCKQCKEIPRIVLKCKCKGNVFCNTCVSHKPCPNCTNTTDYEEDKDLQKKLLKLTVKCPFCGGKCKCQLQKLEDYLETHEKLIKSEFRQIISELQQENLSSTRQVDVPLREIN